MNKESNNGKYKSNSIAQRKEHHGGEIVFVHFVEEYTCWREDGKCADSKGGVEQTGDKVYPGYSKHLQCTQANRAAKDARKQAKYCHYA